MKLSDLSTDRALDALCELTPYINNIVNDQEVVGTIGKVVKPEQALNKYGNFMLVMGRLSEFMPLLLKTHRPDVYGVLSVLNGKTVQDIAAQPAAETLAQIKDALQDSGLMGFFKSFAPQGQTVQSAPSAPSPDSE